MFLYLVVYYEVIRGQCIDLTFVSVFLAFSPKWIDTFTCAKGRKMAKKKCMLLLIWDGLRPDFVRPEWTPNLCKMGRDGVVFQRHHAVFPSETRVNSSSLATGCYPGTHGITGNQIYVPKVSADAPLNTGDHGALEAVARSGELLFVPTLSDRLSEAGLSFAVVSSGSPGSSFLQCPSGAGLMVNVRGVVRPAHLEAAFGPYPEETIPATARNDRATEILVQQMASGDHAVIVGWFCDPDATQHKVGLGADLALRSIRESDARLGSILSVAEKMGCDVLVGSDHGFSTLSEPAKLSDVLNAAGVGDAVHTAAGIWLPDVSDGVLNGLVDALMAQPWVGTLFTRGKTAEGREGVPGTFSFGLGLVNHPMRTPDVMFSHAWTDEKNVFGIPGMARGSAGVASHGTNSPYDMHNVLIARGPNFQSGLAVDVPSGLIDIAPTLYYLATGQVMPGVDGRILREALCEACAPERIEKRVYEVHKAGRTQFLEIHEVDGTRYMEKGWVTRA